MVYKLIKKESNKKKTKTKNLLGFNFLLIFMSNILKHLKNYNFLF